jgi:hypothetical protein
VKQKVAAAPPVEQKLAETVEQRAQAAQPGPAVEPKLKTAPEGKDNAKPSPFRRKPSKSIDELLGEMGKQKGGSGVGEAAPKPKAKLVTLAQVDIVAAMKGVQPKVQACANQFKQPGTAMAAINVAAGGKVTGVTVTGKFAGTPAGACVEAAAKSAKFPPCQAMSFPWPFTLSPRESANKAAAPKAASKADLDKEQKELFFEPQQAAPPPQPEIPLLKQAQEQAAPQAEPPPSQATQTVAPTTEGKGKAKSSTKSSGGKKKGGGKGISDDVF